MKGKAKTTGKFTPSTIRDLPPSMRADRKERTAIAARRRVDQAKYVLDKEETAIGERAKRVDAAKKELAAAEAALAVAEKAAPAAT